MAEVNRNTRDQFRHGRLPERVRNAVLARLNEAQGMSTPILEDDDQAQAFTEVVIDMLLQRQETRQPGEATRQG